MEIFLGLTDWCWLSRTCRPNWEAWSAIGTTGAAAIALGIALEGGLTRRADQKARARAASIMLWPNLRQFLAGLKRLRRHKILLGQPLLADEQNELANILHALGGDLPFIERCARDLRGADAERLARVLAHVRHVHRHVTDLRNGYAAPGTSAFEEKVAAVRTSSNRARVDLLEAIQQARANLGPWSPPEATE